MSLKKDLTGGVNLGVSFCGVNIGNILDSGFFNGSSFFEEEGDKCSLFGGDKEDKTGDGSEGSGGNPFNFDFMNSASSSSNNNTTSFSFF